MIEYFLIATLLYSDVEDPGDAGIYSSELRFVGLLLLIAVAGCVIAGLAVLRKQRRRARLQDPRKDHYRRGR